MRDVDGMRARVEAAGDLPDLLQAAWDGFSLLLATCQECEERPGGLFAAFAFASLAAAEGRLVLASAPSLPGGSGGAAGPGPPVHPDLQEIADGLADLAQALAARLGSAAREAGDPGDRDACEQARAEAIRVCGLLARDE